MNDQDSVVFKIEREIPISLERLTFGMMAFGAEYERHLRIQYPQIEDHETDLLVHRVTEKCIWIEMIGAVAPVLQGMDNIVIFKNFVEAIGVRFNALTSPKGRLEDTTPQELESLAKIAETLAGDTSSDAEVFAMEYNSKTNEKKVSAQIAFRAKDADNIIANARDQVREIASPKPRRHDRVLMHLFQTNIGKAVPDRSSGEKGIIEAIGPLPKRLIYASDLAGQRIKSAWGEEDISPYDLLFVVDVDVQELNGKPRAYRILEVHDVFPKDEDLELA